MRKWQVFKNLFACLSGKVYIFISTLHKIFLLSHILIVRWQLQMNGRLLANVSNNETDGVFVLILNTLPMSEIFQISTFSSFPNSDLTESTETCLTILIWWSWKQTAVGTHNNNRNAVFRLKKYNKQCSFYFKFPCFNRVAGLSWPVQMFSCELCEVSKSILSTEQLQVTLSVLWHRQYWVSYHTLFVPLPSAYTYIETLFLSC